LEQPTQLLQGGDIPLILQSAIKSQQRIRMEIPRTSYSGITLFLGFETGPGGPWLTIDQVAGFDQALRLSRNQTIAVSFYDRTGVPFNFSTEVTFSRPKEIWVVLPRMIYRVQRRAFFRIKASLGMEIMLRDLLHQEYKARIKDYSLGGVAFYKELGEPWFKELEVDVTLQDNALLFPLGEEILTIPIPSAEIRRIVDFPPHTIQGALEFLQIPESSRSQLERLIFEQQRLVIQKIKTG
jgi:c-di-GMP-binding flagellar brake protein YcgR